jgi:glycosyltransferase involved in cell wall biosynthesis
VRICHVIDNLFLDRGGPVAVVSVLARMQAEQGHDVAVICRAVSRNSEEHQMLRQLIGDKAMLATPDHGGLDGLLNDFQPEVLHLHAVWESILRRAAAWAHRHEVPWVTSTHGLMHPTAMKKGFLKKRAYLVLLGGFVARSRRVLTLNRQECDSVHRLLHATTEVMPNGVEPPIAQAQGQGVKEFHARFPSIPERPFILAMGRVHAVKGFDRLVRAYAFARSLGDVPDLVIVGPMDGGESDVLEAARTYGVQAHVHLPGALYGPSRFSALQACLMLAHRPRYEGFGMVVAEAMAAGRPIVTTCVTGLAREAPPGLICVATDTDDGFGRALHDAVMRTEETHGMAVRAQAWALRELAWDGIVKRLETCYRDSSPARPCYTR